MLVRFHRISNDISIFPYFNFSAEDWTHISNVEFWVEGVFQCIVAVAGLLGCVVACLDVKSTILGKSHYLLYSLAPAIQVSISTSFRSKISNIILNFCQKSFWS